MKTVYGLNIALAAVLAAAAPAANAQRTTVGAIRQGSGIGNVRGIPGSTNGYFGIGGTYIYGAPNYTLGGNYLSGASNYSLGGNSFYGASNYTVPGNYNGYGGGNIRYGPSGRNSFLNYGNAGYGTGYAGGFDGSANGFYGDGNGYSGNQAAINSPRTASLSDQIEVRTLSGGRIGLTWQGDPTPIQDITFALLDRSRHTLQSRTITHEPAQTSFTRPPTAAYYRVMIRYTDGAVRSLVSPL